MLTGNVTSVVIVYSKDTKIYAELLRDLFSLHDDKDGKIFGVADGSVKAVTMLDKEFSKSKSNTSDQKVIYIGKCEGAESTIKFARWKQNEHGIQYGWFGNKAVILVSETLKKKEEYEAFLKYAKDIALAFENTFSNEMEDSNMKKVGKVLSVASIVTWVWVPFVGIPGVINLAKDHSSKRQKIKDQQYEVAVRDFYMNQSAAFFGE